MFRNARQVHPDLIRFLHGGHESTDQAVYYLNSITLGAKAGYAEIEYKDPVPFIDTDEGKVFGVLYATAYPIDDLSVSVAMENRFDNNSVRLDVEYELPINGLSLFTRTMVAENDYDHFLGGLRFYFGGKKSLKERHRHDDPRSVVQDVLFGIATYGAEYNRLGNDYIKRIRESNLSANNRPNIRYNNLGGENRYSGTTTVSEGTFVLSDGNALPDSNNVFVEGDAILEISSEFAIPPLGNSSDLNGLVVLAPSSPEVPAIIPDSNSRIDNFIKGGILTLSGSNTYMDTTISDPGLILLKPSSP